MNSKISFIKHKCNIKMRRLLDEGQISMNNQKLHCNISSVVTEAIEDLIDYGSVIVGKKNVDSTDGDIYKLLQKHEDFLSCEWNCNEIYIANEVVENNLGQLVHILLKCLQVQLLRKFPYHSFCVMISVDQGEFPNITAHCCQFRDNLLYFDSNLENCNQPVLFAILDGNAEAETTVSHISG